VNTKPITMFYMNILIIFKIIKRRIEDMKFFIYNIIKKNSRAVFMKYCHIYFLFDEASYDIGKHTCRVVIINFHQIIREKIILI